MSPCLHITEPHAGLSPHHLASHPASHCPQSHHIHQPPHEYSEAQPSCPLCLASTWPLHFGRNKWPCSALVAGMQRKEEQKISGRKTYQALRLLACVCTEVLRVQLSMARRAGGAGWCLFKGPGLLDIRQSWSRPSSLAHVL